MNKPEYIIVATGVLKNYHAVHVVIDMATKVSLISKKLVERLEISLNHDQDSTQNGDTVEATVTTTMTLGGKRTIVRLVVADHTLIESVILGRDFLRPNHMCINFVNKVVRIDGSGWIDYSLVQL